MNANMELSLSRRTMLQSTGALVVAFSMADMTDAADVIAQTADKKPPLDRKSTRLNSSHT